MTSGEKSYIDIRSNNLGNIKNFIKIVSSILGHSIVKINEDFTKEISLAPTHPLEN